MVHGAPDFTKVMRGETDEVWIKGVPFRDPVVAACKPISVENPALAYELATDRFKVKIEEWLVGVLSADVSDRAARLLGIIYGDQGQLLQRPTTKDLLVQIRSAGVEIDPRAIRQLIASDIVTAYGSQVQALKQRPTTYELLVQLVAAGAEIDPRKANIQDYDLFRETGLCDKYDLDYDVQGRLQYLKVYDGVTLKMTLTLSYDGEGRLDTIVRS